MANKRMFSVDVVHSDIFLDMPLSSQCLYFHLSMLADDDGLVGSAKRTIRMIGANEDDLKLLIIKNFVTAFESGVLAINHWHINNYIRQDRYKKTIYIDEMSRLNKNDNGVYENLGRKLVDQAATNGRPILDKSSEDENRKEKVRVDHPEHPPPMKTYGKYKNVRLSDNDLVELKNELGNLTDEKINYISEYMESTGRKYKNHKVTILLWHKQDKLKNQSKKGKNQIPNYDECAPDAYL